MSTPFLTTSLSTYLALPALDEASIVNGSNDQPETTRALARAVKDIKRWYDSSAPVIPEAYGVVGDGVTDDTINMQAAIDAAAADGRTVRLRANTTYKLSDGPGLDITGVRLEGGGVTTVLDFGGGSSGDFGVGPDACVWAQGDLGSIADTISAASKGDLTITASTSSHGVAVGDRIILWDPTDSSFNPSRVYYRDGEVCDVIGVSGADITLATPCRSDYASTTRIYNPTWARAGLENLRITGLSKTDQIACATFDLCHESFMRGVWADTGQASLLATRRCFDVDFYDCRVVNDSAPAGLNYGIGIGNSQSVQIVKCNIIASRHAVTIGGRGDDGTFVNRDILVHGCTLSTDGQGGVATADCHGGGEWVTFSKCTILGGLNLGGDHITVEGCNVFSEQNNGIGIQFSEPKGFDFKFSNCRFTAMADPANAMIHYDASVTVDPQGDAQMTFSNCVIDMGDFDGDTMLIRVRLGGDDLRFKASGCEFRRKDDFAVNGVVKVSGYSATSKSLESVEFEDCRFHGTSLYVTDILGRVKISDCHVWRGNQRGFSVTNSFAGTASEHAARPIVEISDCSAIECGQTGFYLDGVGSAYGTIALKDWKSLRNGQTGSGGSSDLAGLFLGNVWLAVVKDGVVGDDQSVSTMVREMVFSTVGKLWETGNVHILDAIPVNTYTAVTAKIGSTVSDAKYAEVYAAAAPTTGYWIKGSKAWNNAPSTGNPVGWVCVGTGTPGTWLPMQNVP